MGLAASGAYQPHSWLTLTPLLLIYAGVNQSLKLWSSCSEKLPIEALAQTRLALQMFVLFDEFLKFAPTFFEIHEKDDMKALDRH